MNKIGRPRSFSQSTYEVIGNNFPLGVPRTIVLVVYILYVVLSYALVVHPVLQSLDSSILKDAVSKFYPFFYLDCDDKIFSSVSRTSGSSVNSSLRASYCVRGWSCFVLSRVHGTLSITSKIKMARVIVSLDSFGWNVCVLRITVHLTLAPFSLMER